MQDNGEKARALVARLVLDFPKERVDCPNGSHHALDHALMTAPAHRDPALMAKLDAVLGRVLKRH
jgi:5'-methylthioadenosine phosphorylase